MLLPAEIHDSDDLWHLLVKLTIREEQKLVKEQELQIRRSGTEQHGIVCILGLFTRLLCSSPR
jgi:hypothetical protein